MPPSNKNSMCPGCGIILKEPYIKCAECVKSLSICLRCFARGIEVRKHKSYHKFEVIKNDFSLFEEKWTAGEELHLLDAISECGIGNWQDVASQLQTKTKEECERHYNMYYIHNAKPPLPEMPDPIISYPPPAIVFKLSEDPPRPPDGSMMQMDMSGYMAARGDFMVEPCNYAESELKDIEFTDEDSDDCETQLKLAVVENYWQVLKERQWKKKIIRDFGLINIKKVMAQYKRFDPTIKTYLDRLLPLLRLLSPVDADMYLETLHYEVQLKNEIRKLQEYRENGITRIRLIHLYESLKQRRKEESEKPKFTTEVMNHVERDGACQQWLQKSLASEDGQVPIPPMTRRSAAPLDVIGLPGYDKLSTKEREICSKFRLIPKSYLDFKELLINECRKHGYLRLAQARQLIKIDVNKTRKLFDFLVEEGEINKEPT
ncbi:transcriptional adapter 2-alpha-like [Tubulanus polymorphus]|uniref:transcriptional adapter 2-alpha-like n=1 Tax=Tubulanus polymorphus TaxID=672921 RepID=UPI003DA63FC7